MSAGLTSVTLPIFVLDSTSSTGAGLALVFNTPNLVAEYRRQGQSSWTTINLVTATLGTFTSSGFIADGSLVGAYELSPPDLALSAGARWVEIRLYGATNMVPVLIEIELDVVNYQSASNFMTGVGGEAVPTNWHLESIDGNGRLDVIKVAGTTQTARDIGASVLLSAGTGTGQLDFAAGVVKSNWVQYLGTALGGTAAQVVAAITKFFNVATPTGTINSLPDAVAGANGGVPTVDVNNNIHGLVPGTGTGQVNANSGKVPATVATGDDADAATAIARLTAARAGYLDNLNVSGAVASHADVLALNQSASKHLLLVTVGQFEPGETYTVEMRTFAAADGAAVNADTTPTLTATGNVSGSLSSNLSAATNPATGVYRWTYTPGASPTLEQIRFDGAATIATAPFTLSAYSQTVDFATVVFTSTDQSHLTSIFNKLPTNNIADETVVLAAVGTPQQAGSAVVLPAVPADFANRAIQTDIQTDVDELQTTLGAAGAGLTAIPDSAALTEIGADVDELIATIGAAGAGLTGIPDSATLTEINADVDELIATLAAGASLTAAERNAIADALLDRTNGVDTGFSVRSALKIVLFLRNISTGSTGGAGNLHVRDAANTKDRLVKTVDAFGNTTAIVSEDYS